MNEKTIYSMGESLLLLGIGLCVLLLIGCILYFTTYLFHSLFNRKKRLAELRHHIDMIRDPHGCSNAIERYKECGRLCERYFLELKDAGFCGNEMTLFNEAMRSFRRYEDRAHHYKL